MSVLAKMDAGLQAIFTSYRDVQARGEANVGRVHPVVASASATYIYLRYVPPLAPIEALGFATVNDDGKGYALGKVRFADLERVAEHAGVVHLATGSAPRPLLDLSIPDIQADKVWNVDRSAKIFTGMTGKGVIVGIIDTGIDFGHPVFRDPLTNSTRILRIWDQGLTPQSGERSPFATQLSAGGTYGVEYTDEDLDAHLALRWGGPVNGKVRHRDCDAHGTHVASIAAGNGSEGGFKYIGVAPEADIVAVKYLSAETDPTDADGVAVPDLKRFKDSIMYVLSVAEDLGKPVVINLSFGHILGPHDGLTDEELFLAEQFPDSAVGRACVVAAGNSGHVANHAHVTLAGGPDPVAVPVLLLDGRKEKKGDNSTCKYQDDTIDLAVEFWYPRGPVVGAAVTVPGGAASRFVAARESTEDFFQGTHKYEITHQEEPDATVGALTAKRNVVRLTVKAAGKVHVEGWYSVQLKSDRAVTFEAFTGSDGGWQNMRFPDRPGEAIPDEVKVADFHKMASSAGSSGVISVALISSEPDPPIEPPFDPYQPPHHGIQDMSSAGGLVDYTGTLPAAPTKPELAAPGYDIDAAKSAGACWFSYARLGLVPYGYASHSGTSMSSPHVAGAIALMLQAKPTLKFGKIRELLKASVDPRPTTTDPERDLTFLRQYGAGRLNVKAAVDAARAQT